MLELLDWRLDARRRRLSKRVPEGPLRQFLKTPFPDPDQSICDTPILSVDFETTGFDQKKDQILSIGFVSIDALSIRLNSVSHDVVRVDSDLKASNVIIHKITDNEKNAGTSVEQAISNLLEHLQGRILLAHFNKTEVGFLTHTCKRIYGYAPLIPTLDTLDIAARRLNNSPSELTRENLRLFNLRKRYNLPEYTAHNALLDALSTAELFLAQVNHLPDGINTRLSQLT